MLAKLDMDPILWEMASSEALQEHCSIGQSQLHVYVYQYTDYLQSITPDLHAACWLYTVQQCLQIMFHVWCYRDSNNACSRVQAYCVIVYLSFQSCTEMLQHAADHSDDKEFIYIRIPVPCCDL